MRDGRFQVRRISLWPLAIPMRRSFKHATHQRSQADPIVVEVELASHVLGYGETLPRRYVTGESRETVLDDILGIFLPAVLSLRPGSLPEAFEALETLPFADADGRCVTAARAAVELALLDAYSRHFRRPLTDLAGWIGLPRFGPPGSVKRVTYSAVASADEVDRLSRNIRRMRWFRLRDFKVKVATDNDPQRIAAVLKRLGPALRSGRCSLRVDANGGWNLEQATAQLQQWNELPIRAVEQPLPRDADADLSKLRAATTLGLMYDESLITLDDAENLVVHQVVDYFNIRLSKNGGLIPALRLAEYARKHNVKYQLGCMVGETSVLSAAGRRFLEIVPDVAFAEGSYGRFLLTDDITRRQVRFGLGGRIKPIGGLGWGLSVLPEALTRLAERPPVHHHL